MDRANTNKLLDTVASFIRDLDEIENARDQRELSALERRAVNKLQLSQVEIEMAGRDLHEIVSRRRGELRKGV